MKKINNTIIKMLKSTAPRLIYALICGAAYFAIIMNFVAAHTAHAALMALLIAPAVICGGAYIIIGLLRSSLEGEEENTSAALMLFYINVWVIVIAAVFTAAMLMGLKIM